MLNVTTKTKGNKLIIEIDMTKDYGFSKSGKTIMVASTQGNKIVAEGGLTLGLNLYKYPSKEGK